MLGWFIGILCQVIIDIQTIQESTEREKKARATLPKGADLFKAVAAEYTIRSNIYKYSLPKNIPDLIISANGFNLVEKLIGHKINDGTVGLLGVISGATVCTQVWNSIA